MDVPVVTYSVREKSWILMKDFYYAESLDIIKIPKGFRFDLASIPRILWIFIPPFGLSIIAPLIHDYLYDNGGMAEITYFNRRRTDKLFKRLMERDGVSKVRTFCGYIAVRSVGWMFWNPVVKKSLVKNV